MAASGFSINITAIDAASAKIDAVNKKLASLRAPAENLQKSLKKFGDLSGLTKGFEKLHEGMKKSFDVLSKIVPAFGLLTAGGIVAGIVALVRTWDEFATQLTVTSKLIGILPSQLQALDNANRLMGGSAGDAAAKLANLSATLEDAAYGRNKDARMFFFRLGLSMQDMADMAKDPVKGMGRLADAIYKVSHGANALPAATVAKMFAGYMTPEEIAVAMDKGNAGLEEYRKEAKKNGALSDVEISQLKTQEHALKSLQERMEFVASKFVVALIPAIKPWLDYLLEWSSHQENIDRLVDTFTKGLIELSQWLTKIGKGVQSVVDFFGGWKNTLELIIAVKVASFALGLIGPFAKLALAIGGANTSTLTLLGNLKLLTGLGLLAGGAAAVNAGLEKLEAMVWGQKEVDDRKKFEGHSSLFNPKEPSGGTPEGGPASSGAPSSDEAGAEKDDRGNWYDKKSQQWLPLGTPSPSGESSGGDGEYKPQSWEPGGNAAGGPNSGAAVAPDTSSKDAFLASVMPKAIEESKKTGVDPRIIAAQAGLETGWGKHAPQNNYFGIKGSGGSQTTQEFENGHMVTKQQNFAGYQSPTASFDAYADFLNKNPRYAALKAAKGLDAQAGALQASGYATDPNYGSKVLAIAKGIPMTVNTASAKTPPITGALKVDINHNNAPAGSNVTASASGAMAAPRVVQPMASFA